MLSVILISVSLFSLFGSVALAYTMKTQEKKELDEFLRGIITEREPLLKIQENKEQTIYKKEAGKFKITFRVNDKSVFCNVSFVDEEKSKKIYSVFYHRNNHIFNVVAKDEEYTKNYPQTITGLKNFIIVKFHQKPHERIKNRANGILENLKNKAQELKKEQMKEQVLKVLQGDLGYKITSKSILKKETKALSPFSKEVEEKVKNINELYHKLQSKKEELSIEAKHNTARLYERDLEDLLNAYLRLEDRDEKDEKVLIASLNTILEKIREYDEVQKKEKRYDFEKITETIKVRK